MSLTINIKLPRKQFALEINQCVALTGITAIFGYSGAGKTSLLRVIAGLEKQVTGELIFNQTIWLNSENKQYQPCSNRGVGLVFQDNRLFPHLTVAENLAYASKRAKHNRINFTELVKTADIEKLLEQYPDSLSGGEQQRVSIARAILNEPELLLLDEPFSALDMRNKASLIGLLTKLNQHYHIPMFYVSHSLDDIQQLANKMIVLKAGQLIHYGDTREVIHQLNYKNMIRQQTSLQLPINQQLSAQLSQYGLMALTLNTQENIYLNQPNIPLSHDSLMNCYIDAKDISICLVEPNHSSVVNHLSATIIKITKEDKQAMVEVRCAQQPFFTVISLYSLEYLALKPQQSVYIQFKASSIKTLSDNF
ncbi:MAG: molybdenum ABC transporter ATP-binding protein [Thalassotalea sp.]